MTTVIKIIMVKIRNKQNSRRKWNRLKRRYEGP